MPGSTERRADMALTFIRHTLATHVYEPTMCNFEHYYEIGDTALARVKAAADANPDDHILTALLAQVHIDRGWCVRGGGWAFEVDEEGWRGLLDSFQTAHALLARFDPRETGSPTLARVAFQLLAAEEHDQTVENVRQAYEAWSDLDIANPQPHRSFAFFVMPRWYGSWKQLEDEARAAAKRTRHGLGSSAYALIYLQALSRDDDALRLMDLDLLEKALNDLVERDPVPAREALRLGIILRQVSADRFVPIWDEVFCRRALNKRAALKSVGRRLLERHVTCLPAKSGSGFERTALDAIVWYFAKELKSGLHLDWTPEGLKVVPAPS